MINQPDKCTDVPDYSFTKYEMINQPDKCTDVTDYSFTKCLNNYVQKHTGCKMDWNLTDVDPSLCPIDVSLKKCRNLDFLDIHQLAN